MSDVPLPATRKAPSVARGAGSGRDYGVFDADLAGKALDLKLLRRLLHWVKPHLGTLAWSGVLVVIASVLAIMMPVIVSRVVIDGLLIGNHRHNLPDFGMNATVSWVALHVQTNKLFAAGLLFAILSNFINRCDYLLLFFMTFNWVLNL